MRIKANEVAKPFWLQSPIRGVLFVAGVSEIPEQLLSSDLLSRTARLDSGGTGNLPVLAGYEPARNQRQNEMCSSDSAASCRQEPPGWLFHPDQPNGSALYSAPAELSSFFSDESTKMPLLTELNGISL